MFLPLFAGENLANGLAIRQSAGVRSIYQKTLGRSPKLSARTSKLRSWATAASPNSLDSLFTIAAGAMLPMRALTYNRTKERAL